MEIRKVEGPASSQNHPVSSSKPIPSTIRNSKNKDSVRVSQEAHMLEDEAFITDILSQIPDIDTQKMEKIKQQLSAGKYDNSLALEKVAEKILKALGEDI